MTQFLVARFVQGTSVCYRNGRLRHDFRRRAFGQTKTYIKLMAIITSIGAGRSGYRPALRRRADALDSLEG